RNPQIRTMWLARKVGTFLRIRTARRAVPTSLLFVFVASAISAQTPTPGPTATAAPEEETIVPTFETQKQARTYILDIPAPRGQITDRYGAPLAQNRISYNLAITFPTPLDFTDAAAIAFAREKIAKAEKLIERPLKISDE